MFYITSFIHIATDQPVMHDQAQPVYKPTLGT